MKKESLNEVSIQEAQNKEAQNKQGDKKDKNNKAKLKDKNKKDKTKKKQEIDGLILCGTVGPQWAIDGAIQLAEYMVEQKGPRYRSRKLQQLIMQVASWKFENMEYKLEWITRDKKYIEKISKNLINF